MLSDESTALMGVASCKATQGDFALRAFYSSLLLAFNSYRKAVWKLATFNESMTLAYREAAKELSLG
jgi:hypothetical protein